MLDTTGASPYRGVDIILNRSNNSGVRGPICLSQRHASLTPEFVVFSRPYAPMPPMVRMGPRSIIEDLITTLPDANYEILEPIPVKLKMEESGEWIARFEAANIGMTGSDPEEAKELLGYYIIDAMELFLEEEKTLIPKLKRDLNALRHHIKTL